LSRQRSITRFAGRGGDVDRYVADKEVAFAAGLLI
jgi:hypothetical protein